MSTAERRFDIGKDVYQDRLALIENITTSEFATSKSPSEKRVEAEVMENWAK